MKYCPKCQTPAEAVESTNTCPACGAVLQGLDELSAEELDRPVVLTRCTDNAEAEVLKAALGAQGIETLIEDEGMFETLMDIMNPLDGARPTGPRVLVHLKDAEAALEFLRSKESGELAITEDDLPDDNAGPDAPGNA
jgi:hypothetical protein